MRTRTSALLAVVLAALSLGSVAAQSTISPDRGFRPGNSYAISNIETINQFGGNLMLNVPVGSLPPGRGVVGGGISLGYDSKIWDVDVPGAGGPEGFNTQNMIASPDGGWHYQYRYELRHEAIFQGGPVCSDKMYIVFPDGGKHLLWLQGGTNSEGWVDPYHLPDGTLGCATAPPSTVSQSADVSYFTVDGTYLRVVVEGDNDATLANNRWTVYMPDGTRVIYNPNHLSNPEVGLLQRVIDRNGNYVDFVETPIDSAYGGHRTTTLKDQLERKVVLEYEYDHEYFPNEDRVHSRGVGGIDVVTRIKWKTITVQRDYQWCTENCEGGNTVRRTAQEFRVVDRVYLPAPANDLYYQFDYSADATSNPSAGWGEVSGVKLPTGAQTQYSYSQDSAAHPRPELFVTWQRPFQKTLTYLKEYDGTSQPETETWYYGGICSPTVGSTLTCTVTAPDGSQSTEYYGWWNGAAAPSPYYYNEGYYKPLKSISGTGVIAERVYANNIPADPSVIASANQFVKYEFTTIPAANGTPSKTAIKEYSQDKNGNTTEIKEYDFVPYSSAHDGSGNVQIPSNLGDYLVRVTKTDYYNAAPDSASASYSDGNIYAYTASPRSLPSSVEVRDKNGDPKSRSEMSYDYTSYSTNTKAGNLVETKSWDSYKGGSTQSYSNPLTSTNSIATSVTYNSYGMPLTTTDANGNVTQITYGNVTGPNGNVTDLYPTQTVAAYGTTLARTSTAVYDFYTGLATSTTDEDNDLVNATEYDALGRPTKSIVAPGNAVYESWTTTTYNDAGRYVVVRSDIEAKEDGRKVATQFYDQLGRVRLSKTLEDATTQSAINETDGIKVQTRYLASGQCTFDNTATCSATLTSNPYRAGYSYSTGSENTMGWTLTQTRADGKYSEVETFGGAALPKPFITSGYNTNSAGAVKTAVDANATTVTDQASKVRRSVTNALGQLVRVDEPTSSGLGTVASPYQPTAYTYDVLNNLLTVTQSGSGTEQCGPGGGSCSQGRTFGYSSLSRLLSANNPESGTISYTYDANGNLKTKRDARNIKTVYDYDALNRVTTRCYRSIGTGSLGMNTCDSNTETVEPNTPDVAYTYDNVTHAKGKLTKVSTSFSTTEYLAFDVLGRVTRSKQTTDGDEYGGGTDEHAWMTYSYNLAGQLVEQQYPSGRVVQNVLDANGDLSVVRGKKDASHTYWNYAQSFTYSPAGAATRMVLGNALWESTSFNGRLQPTRIALGTGPSGTSATDTLELDYSYGDWSGSSIDPAKNNGNVVQQVIAVPNSPGQTDGFAATQKYTYDQLNRIDDAAETVGSAQTWRQDFQYDRYGNRGLNEANTTTIPRQCGTSPSLTVCTADRQKYNPAADPGSNRLSPGQGYSYDASGNTTADPRSMTFTYDGENKQVEVRDPSISTTSDPDADLIGRYWYDGDGKRVKKYAPPRGGDPGETTIFVYDAGGKQIAEYSTAVATQTQAKVSYLTSDHLGSPRINTDASGAVISRHDYHPFGEEISTPQRINHPEYAGDRVRKQFTGYERDKETELDFAQARYYAKELGRFMEVDPVLGSADIAEPQTWNRYSYALACPLKFSDPLGLYTYDENVSADDRKKLDKAYADLVSARDHYKEGSKKYAAINDALKTLGKPGEANGIIISSYADANPGYTSSSADYTDGKTNGQATTYINIDISKAHTDDRSGFDLASALGHEATHAHDQRALIASLSGLDSAQYELAAADSAKLIQKSTTEFNAYRVSSYVAEAMLPTKYANVTVNDYEIWNRGWSSADETKKRDLGIRGVLESPKGSYRFKFTGGKKDSPSDPRLWTNGGDKRIINN